MTQAKRKIPMRKCTGCLEMKTKRELIRVVRTLTGELVLDSTGKKPGRGAYLCPCAVCFERAFKNKGFERSFGHAVPKTVYDQIKADLELCQ